MEDMNIKVFSNETFGNVRVVMNDGEPWFIAADVCKALELDQVSNSIRKLDEDEKALISIKGISRGNDQVWILNESGLYSLVLGSRKPEAKAFKRWITHEVIPSIRKHGVYMTDEAIEKFLNNPDNMIKLLKAFKQEKDARIQAENKVNQLSDLNSVLASENMEWTDFSIINAMVRKYAIERRQGKISYGWSDFYKEILYNCGINLKARHTNWCAKNPKKKIAIYRMLTDEEMQKAIVIFASMCENNGVDVGDIISNHKKQAKTA